MSVLFFSQSRIEIIPNLSLSLQTTIISPFDPRVLLVLSVSCPSGCVVQIAEHLDLLVLLFRRYNHILTSFPISLPFLRTPVTSLFDPRVRLVIFSVSLTSQVHARLVLLCLLFGFHNQILTSKVISLSYRILTSLLFSLSFRQTSIASTFNPRVLLVFVSVSCSPGIVSPIHGRLFLLICSFALTIIH